MFDFVESELPGCLEIKTRLFEDQRGKFIKIFHRDMFRQHGLNTDWQEEYYSVSHQGVLRGLHFQLPPHDHAKLVYCTSGEVMDVVVDLRKGSPKYGKSIVFNLSASKGNMVYIPRGMAHGFYTLSPSATMHYMVETVYAPNHDAGILWNSIAIDWPNDNPVISERDSNFPEISAFVSPFIFCEEE